MRNFELMAAGIDVAPLRHAITRQPDLWNANTLRTAHPGTAHSEVDDIWLWFNATDTPETVPDDRETIPYPAWPRLPQVRPLIFDLMRRVEGTRLGRVIVTRLAPGKSIAPHADAGAPADYYERYQFALQSLPGCLFTIGDETVSFATGDVWHIDNRETHAVVNNSADDRLAMIVDIRAAA